jgi:hypothetical protein
VACWSPQSTSFQPYSTPLIYYSVTTHLLLEIHPLFLSLTHSHHYVPYLLSVFNDLWRKLYVTCQVFDWMRMFMRSRLSHNTSDLFLNKSYVFSSIIFLTFFYSLWLVCCVSYKVMDSLEPDRKHLINQRKSSQTLTDALLASRLAVPLYIAFAQQRTHLTFSNDTSQLKLLGFLFDMVHTLSLSLSLSHSLHLFLVFIPVFSLIISQWSIR